MSSFEVPDDITPSNFLDKPGTYHVMCSLVEDPAKKDDGSILDGISFTFGVLAGTDSSQEKRTVRVTIYNPNMSHSDGGLFARKRFARLARALGMRDKASGKLIDQCRGMAVELDWQDARGKQAVIRFVHGKDRDGKQTKFMDIDGLQIYSVHDEEVKDIPKREKALKMLADAEAAAAANQEKQVEKPAPAQPKKEAAKDWEAALFG